MDISLADSLWVLLSAFLVFFMHAGFALLESGLCRRKNAVAVLMKNFGVVAVASITFYLVGYGVMFGEGTVAGAGPFAPDGDGQVGSIPLLVHVFFQLVFAATACTIVSGAVAERSKLGPFLLFTALATALIYPLVGHAVWGGGVLAKWGFVDFAGSTVVHLVGGAMALAGAQVVGPRRGKFDEERSKPMRAHNLPLAALGVMILWLGWFGFNGGSTLSAAEPGVIARIVLVTNLSAAAGFLAALAYVKARTGTLDFSMGLNGALAGLVSITAGCDQIAPVAAIGVGVLGAIICTESVLFLERRKIDDPVGAIAVHGAAGFFGTVAVGIFGSGRSLSQLGIQLAGALLVFAFAYGSSSLLWRVLRATIGVRVDAAHEDEGLDLAECGVPAYGEEMA
ncbi:MAG: Amt family ammonium transporter [Polyangiales bacterium]|jgi:Amt family ammonium transporter